MLSTISILYQLRLLGLLILIVLLSSFTFGPAHLKGLFMGASFTGTHASHITVGSVLLRRCVLRVHLEVIMVNHSITFLLAASAGANGLFIGRQNQPL